MFRLAVRFDGSDVKFPETGRNSISDAARKEIDDDEVANTDRRCDEGNRESA